ncbi:MFS general substrate transporter [Schizophyllum commune Tattone D]|nr:MFS general substrate transporter [Schizophyllum commune Tattone D]
MSGRASLSSTIVPEQRDEVSQSREDVAAKPPVDDGICVDWDGPDDPANPRNWSLAKKWRITCICSLITFNIALASTLPTSATPFIRIYMGMEKEVSYLITTMFLLGYVFGPFVWGPGSELVGRKAMFYVSMVLYLIFIIPSALAKNTATLLVSRFLTGFFGCAPLALVGGVIADMFPAEGRGLAASLFTVGVFLGPSVGPIIAGYMLDNAVSWRWIFWLLLIFSGFCVAMLFLFVPETYEPTLLKWKARRLRKADPQGNARLYAPNEREDWSPAGVFHSTIYRPFHMFFTEPILLLVTVYVSLVYGILYALFSAIPVVFVTRRNFSISHMGLIFIAVSIGTTLGAFINIVLSAHYPRLIREWRGFPPPEQRLLGAMVGGPLMVVGAFWLGWTGEYADVHWAAPAGSLILIGASISLVFMSFLSYLVDTYLHYSASAFSVNTTIRSLVAAAFPLFTTQMFTELGVNWAGTLIGLVCLVLVPVPFLFYKYGPRIRTSSGYAPCVDLKIAKEIADNAAAAQKIQDNKEQPQEKTQEV